MLGGPPGSVILCSTDLPRPRIPAPPAQTQPSRVSSQAVTWPQTRASVCLGVAGTLRADPERVVGVRHRRARRARRGTPAARRTGRAPPGPPRTGTPAASSSSSRDEPGRPGGCSGKREGHHARGAGRDRRPAGDPGARRATPDDDRAAAGPGPRARRARPGRASEARRRPSARRPATAARPAPRRSPGPAARRPARRGRRPRCRRRRRVRARGSRAARPPPGRLTVVTRASPTGVATVRFRALRTARPGRRRGPRPRARPPPGSAR